ncbi:MAG: molybdate transport system regulatory protein [Moorella sp. (in: firmicutes)]|jgi:molybdate transport system regulatory protein|uniref:winged helix-turn-helix domain-containing protein n=2 Tax=unclassified Neomoorella TaxID=2676739 RepID=UPI0010FFBFC1|nr:LysR family transcriptional regulator [Moorella sp. E306M]MDK2816486.1 molybdate transport system regulatory protein [Moorella sp. (in: firmicutes)]MDK2894545.1 molybdate transport system regulatory protein [Moorella sp. (in: firmicutes)]GEA14540.1 ModE family transcriptional regulator [Moorella sp. E308F]GEA18089.1 ModE family transcriptional regulator [Moorella sp. E306M]
MRVRYKFWLEDGEHIFGEGLFELLQEIDRRGSINQAARSLNMSYRQAWGQVKKAEGRLGERLLSTRVGGETGGGAELTPAGRWFLQRYKQFRRDAGEAIEAAFQRHFG